MGISLAVRGVGICTWDDVMKEMMVIKFRGYGAKLMFGYTIARPAGRVRKEASSSHNSEGSK